MNMATYNITKIEQLPNVLHVEYDYAANGEVITGQVNFGLDYLQLQNGTPMWKNYLDDYVSKCIAWYVARKAPGAKVSFEQYLGEQKV
jgi:hypothetical protein